MIIKSFTAESTAAALKLIRQEMGGDAIVLKTRHLSKSGGAARIEVTACLEKPSVAQSSVLLAAEGEKSRLGSGTALSTALPIKQDSQQEKTESINRLAELVKETDESNSGDNTIEQKSVVPESDLSIRIDSIDQKLEKLLAPSGISRLSNYLHPELDSIANILALADFPRDFILSFIGSLEEEFPHDGDFRTVAHRRLVTVLSKRMTPSLKFEAGDSLLFMGPAGCGKTSLMGKLAVRLIAQDGMKVCLATLDDHKLAAQDELQTSADILGIEARELDRKSQLEGKESGMITLIDSPAMPVDPKQFDKLRADIDTLNPTYRFGLFSAMTRSADTADIAKKMSALSPTDVVITMLDLTSRYGSIISATETTDRKIAFVTDAPGGAGTANVPDPDRIVRTIFRTEAAIEPTQTT